MRCVRWKTWLLVLSLAVVPVYGDEDVDLLIAYILDELESSQIACDEVESAQYAGQRVVCGSYDESFSALKSDWNQIMRHTLLPMPISTNDAWTYRADGFRITYRYGGDSELHVDARDPATLATTVVTVALAALVASYLPARRASRIDPMGVLRME